MVSLRQHLRADEDRRFAARDQFEVRCHSRRAARAVAVDAQHRRTGKIARDTCLAALCADANGAQRRITTIRTAVRQRRCKTTVVTAQPGWCLVQRQPAFAAWTACIPAAARAHESRRITAAVDEQQYLIAACECCRDGGSQWRADAVVERQSANVDEADFGWLRRAGTRREAQMPVTAAFGVVELSNDGVAVPISNGMLRSCARLTARSRAE